MQNINLLIDKAPFAGTEFIYVLDKDVSIYFPKVKSQGSISVLAFIEDGINLRARLVSATSYSASSCIYVCEGV